MKKTLFFLFAVLFSLNICSQEIPINIQEDPPEYPNNPHRGNTSLPTVTYEDNNVYVYAPYYIESMEVIIYDATGEVIYIPIPLLWSQAEILLFCLLRLVNPSTASY